MWFPVGGLGRAPARASLGWPPRSRAAGVPHAWGVRTWVWVLLVALLGRCLGLRQRLRSPRLVSVPRRGDGTAAPRPAETWCRPGGELQTAPRPSLPRPRVHGQPLPVKPGELGARPEAPLCSAGTGSPGGENPALSPHPSLSFPTVTEAVTAPTSSHRWLLWVSNAMALCATQRRGFAGKVSGNRFELRPWPYLTCSK